MYNKLNEQKINTYSEQVAQKLLDSFFSDKERISGEEILNFCSIKQVNLFTLRVLFQTWKTESKKLESPYFDYDNTEVIAALDKFQNIVSRHILVDQASFKPILLKAISDSLLLICSPYHFYQNELNAIDQQDTSPIEALNGMKKFTKINTAILDGLIDNLNQSKKSTDTFDTTQVLDKVVESLTSAPEEIGSYIDAFSSYVPLDINDIYLEIEEPPTHQEPEHISPDISEKEQAQPVSIGLFEEPTLNESLASENQQSLADLHENQKIDSLSKGITLNQRFMFVNVLFGGDVAKFNNTVVEMDGLTDLAEAKNYVKTRLNHWDTTSDEIEEFMKVLDRRFS